MLDNVAVVLFRPKYSENVGMAARACVNMGAGRLILVDPPNYDPDKAQPLATAQGKALLSSIETFGTLAEALEGVSLVMGTTARTGGWRKGILNPAKAASHAAGAIRSGGSAAIVFGPEDRGLTNDQTRLCHQLMTIPTSRDCSSLNLAQAVLITLYECFKAALDSPFEPAGPPVERPALFQERETLFSTIQETLLAIDFLKKDNPDYWMMPVKRFLNQVPLRRNDFNLLMGICRQVKWIAGFKPKKD